MHVWLIRGIMPGMHHVIRQAVHSPSHDAGAFVAIHCAVFSCHNLVFICLRLERIDQSDSKLMVPTDSL